MAQPIISPKVRQLFQEHFVKRHPLREITEAFDGAGIRCADDYEPNVSGERRTLVQKYYRTVDWSSWKDVRKILKLFETELKDLLAPLPEGVESFDPQWAESRRHDTETIVYWLGDDGFVLADGKLQKKSGGPSGLEDLSELS